VPRRSVRIGTVLTIAVAAVTVFAAVALAQVINGTPGNDNLRGTPQADQIDAQTGNDRVAARAGDDTVQAGPGFDLVLAGRGNDNVSGGDGNDRLAGGRGNDTVGGDAGDDRVFGGSGDDSLAGDAGDDTIFANLGVDTELGGDGNDQLWALARRDRHGRFDTQGDTLHGGKGNDTFRTRDGEADRIDCGPGDDTALLDFKDVILDAMAANPNGSCEHVIRRRARHPRRADRRHEQATENPTAPAEPEGADQ
jgi:Ca2+-binding RTX toxin-like protein